MAIGEEREEMVVVDQAGAATDREAVEMVGMAMVFVVAVVKGAPTVVAEGAVAHPLVPLVDAMVEEERVVEVAQAVVAVAAVAETVEPMVLAAVEVVGEGEEEGKL